MNDNLTKSAKQTLLFFENFVRKKEVSDFISKYRKILKLPESGIKLTEEEKRTFSLQKYIESSLNPQKNTRTKLPKHVNKNTIPLINTCIIFTRKQGVQSYYIPFLLMFYILFNETILIPEMFDMEDDLLKLEHLPSELSWFSDEDPVLLKATYEHFENISTRYPIALYINPEASQRQIQDFIAKNYAFIEASKKDIKNKITGHRRKSTRKQERNDFIYKNRNLPRKKITQLVNHEFPDLEDIDYGNVGKIISLEKKRRESK